jgi:hypothetical protein
MRHKQSFLHPFLFAAFPVFSLYAANAEQLVFSVVFRPLGIFLGVTTLILSLLNVIVDDVDRAALMTTALLLISYTFGSLWKLIPKTIFGPYLKALPYAWFIFAVLIIYLAFKAIMEDSHLESLIRGTTISALVLMASTVAMIIVRYESITKFQAPTSTPHAMIGHRIPNIYYIILDGYGRQDILKDYLDYDNTRFVHFLESRGFYVSPQSRSNYGHTMLSLSSSLNMRYIPELDGHADQQVQTTQLIRYNTVSNYLKNKGYRIIHFNSGWIVTAENALAEITFDSSKMDEFDSTLLFNAVPRFIVDKLVTNHERATILYNLAKLSEVPKIHGAKFVFAHFICPHPPFVFNRTGQMPKRNVLFRVQESKWQPKSHYLDQMAYMTDCIEKVIDRILKDSANPPVIILQSDHGPACDGIQNDPSYLQVRERTTILNAYFVPPQTRRQLYKTITPVNTFRILFNTLFGAHFARLPDRTFYSGQGLPPFTFSDMTDMSRLPQRPAPVPNFAFVDNKIEE